jgi:hypothetical protein
MARERMVAEQRELDPPVRAGYDNPIADDAERNGYATRQGN